METRDQQIRYLEDYHENRCTKLFSEGRKEDAKSIYHEMNVNIQDSSGCLFLQFVSEI